MMFDYDGNLDFPMPATIPIRHSMQTFNIAADPEIGINPKDLCGARKPPLELIPASAQILEAMVLKFGAFGTSTRKGYGAFNWRDKKVQTMLYVGAALRHLSQWVDGQDDDPESGVSHLAHARATIGILIDAIENECIIDNRPKAGRAAELIQQNTAPVA